MWYRGTLLPYRTKRWLLLSRRSDESLPYRSSTFALLGICIYLAGLVLPLPSYLALAGLALMSTLALAFGSRQPTLPGSPLSLAVLAFLASVGLSTLVSEDIGRSLRLSAALLPSILLFVLVKDHLEGLRQIRLLYLMCSAVALVLAVLVLWAAAWHGRGSGGMWALLSPSLGAPILVVRNDITLLAVIAPLSLVLFYREPRGGMGIIAAAAILLSLGAICISVSRTAALTLIIGLVTTTLLVQRRQRLLRSLAGIFALLCVALVFNALLFPESQVITRLVGDWTLSGRTDFWVTAWVMFQQAPLLGNGPHTFGVFNRIPWAHNLYLEVLAEQGLFGLTALGGVVVCGLFGAWKVQRTGGAEARSLGAGALGALISFWSAAAVELSLLREWVVATLFMLLGIICHLLSSQEGCTDELGLLNPQSTSQEMKR
jgi:O-antigen ligase